MLEFYMIGVFIAPVLIICLFWAALAKPERIRSVVEFRIAGLLLGLSIVLPFALNILLYSDSNSYMSGFSNSSAPRSYLSLAPVVLLMLALVFGLDSVTPRQNRDVE